MKQKVTPDSVCCVVVAFHPSADWRDLLRPLSRQSGQVVVVANSPLEIPLPDCRILQNERNEGVARALNQGLEAANQAGFEYALLFDQDTRLLSEGFMATFLRLVNAYPHPEKVAVFKARHRESATGGTESGPLSAQDWFESPTAITSGSLVSVALWKALGGFREDFFIDHVDHEYCLRAGAKGYRVVQSVEVLLDHHTGTLTPVRIAGRAFFPMHQPANRWYFGTRNLVALHRSYASSQAKWLLREDFAWMKRILKMCLWEKDRRGKLVGAFRGFVDGWQL